MRPKYIKYEGPKLKPYEIFDSYGKYIVQPGIDTLPLLLEREKYMIYNILNYRVSRYLFTIESGSNIGHLRYTIHLQIASFFAWYFTSEGGEHWFGNIDEPHDLKMDIHNWIGRYLTDYLDEKIGFDIHKPVRRQNVEELTRKFIDYLLKYYREMMGYAFYCDNPDNPDLTVFVQD